jgi:hypothetical protein
MEVDDLAAHYPQLFHMAEAGAWPSIQKHGLRSTQALLDLFEIEEPQRSEILETRRPQIIPIAHPTHGTALIRDNKPLKDSFLAKCLTDMTIPDWYAHLNGKVFFWVTETRLNELLAARAYRNRAHDVITIDTRRLLDAHLADVTLASFNTGATLYPNAPDRGSETFQTIPEYQGDTTRTNKLRRPVVELTVNYSVPNIEAVAIRAERREHDKLKQVLWRRR